MTDLIRADPDVLDAYAAATRGPRIEVWTSLDRYRRAWDALTAAEAVPAIAVPPSRADAIDAAMEDLRQLDGLTSVMARALRELDRNGDGAISAADGLVLADHPELLALLFPDGTDAAGEAVLEVLVEDFDLLAAFADRPGGEVVWVDLEAAAGDGSLPLRLQAAAQWLVDNPTVFDLIVSEASPTEGVYNLHADLTAAGIEFFLATNEHLRNLVGHTDALDTAYRGGDPDGFVSLRDLEAAAGDVALPARVRAAAEHLLEHPWLLTSIANPPSMMAPGARVDFGEGVTARLINGQAHAHDPASAAAFVRGLPVPVEGATGLSIRAISDDGFRALANASLRHVEGSLTGTQEIIARLPETADGRRNELITSFYDLVAARADAVFAEAGGATSGDPTSAGHPGANWLHFAPWASDGVHDVVSGDFRALGIFGPSGTASQAAADGNQWIFDDITSRFAAFVELHEGTGGAPSSDELQRFFDTSFGEGDGQIRDGFVAYSLALGEDDPAARQALMFQGNTLVAVHEQAGAHEWVGMLSGLVPDHLATAFIDVQMGDHTIHVDRDLGELANEHNLVVPAPILDLDPARLSATDLTIPGVDLADLEGWEDRFEVSTERWHENAGGIPIHSYPPTGAQMEVDPDQTLAGTGAISWPDYEQRMWNIHRLFEQLHTDPSIHDTTTLRSELDLDWLDDDVRQGVTR